MKQAARAHRRLAELKGAVLSILNTTILINTLSLQEAKDSSAVESIITTHDELYKAELSLHIAASPATKEVQSYSDALIPGFELFNKHGLLTCNDIIEIFRRIKHSQAGFRVIPGTTLINDRTGEAVHPFSDGNGKTGRIINILYLVLQGLLDLPVLYLSRYIIKNKGEYYRLLQLVKDKSEWEQWILFLLKGLEETSLETVSLIMGMKQLMMDYKKKMRNELPKVYS